jgi:hypothetical protein
MDCKVRDELTRWQGLAAKVSAENDSAKLPELLKELCEEPAHLPPFTRGHCHLDP